MWVIVVSILFTMNSFSMFFLVTLCFFFTWFHYEALFRALFKAGGYFSSDCLFFTILKKRTEPWQRFLFVVVICLPGTVFIGPFLLYCFFVLFLKVEGFGSFIACDYVICSYIVTNCSWLLIMHDCIVLWFCKPVFGYSFLCLLVIF